MQMPTKQEFAQVIKSLHHEACEILGESSTAVSELHGKAVGALEVSTHGFFSRRRVYAALGIGAAAGAAWLLVKILADYKGYSLADVKLLSKSWLIQLALKRKNQGIKHAFREGLTVAEVAPRANHPHGHAAAQRSQADHAIQNFVAAVGMVPYPVSKSARDKTNGLHLYNVARDLAFGVEFSKITPKSVLTMIDVDYYLDMASYVRTGQPIVLYTFIPQRAGAILTDSFYTIESDVVKYCVNGGGTYEHQIWDYGTDFVKVKHFLGSTFCSVERKNLGDERQIVLICPEFFVAWPFDAWVDAPVLKRARYSRERVNIVRSQIGGKQLISVGVAGSTASVTVDSMVFESIRIRYQSSAKPAISDIERLLPVDMEGREHAAPILYEVLRKRGDDWQARDQGLLVFQAIGPLRTEDGKARGRACGPSLTTTPAVVPALSYNNDVAAVQGRILKVSNNKVPSGRYVEYAQEFAKLLVPSPGRGSPLSSSAVYEAQDKPRQRARLDARWDFIRATKNLVVRVFTKSETYPRPSDPRVISGVDESHNLLLSAYAMSFKQDVLASLPWYAPTKAPPAIESRMLEVTHRQSEVHQTDFSRFDGSISKWLRINVEQAVYLRWVSHRYHPELLELLSKEVRARCMTAGGVRYSVSGHRLSGSPITTDGNTMINAYVTYSALRASNSPQEAFKLLGLYAGDDGLSVCNGDDLKKAALDLGLSLDLVTVKKGFVRFLGRVFSDPLNGDVGSVQDPVRTYPKLHISFADRQRFSDPQALVNKAYGYLVLDPMAPVTSEWCRAVILMNHAVKPQWDETDLPYWATLIQRGECTWTQMERNRAVELISYEYCVAASDVQEWITKIDDAKELAHLGGIIPRIAPMATIKAVFMGNVHLVINPPMQKRGKTQAIPPAQRTKGKGTNPQSSRDRPRSGSA